MKVRAKETCFVVGRRRPGEVFDYEPPAGQGLPAHLEAVKDDVPVGRPARPAGPPETDTLSEMARRAEPRPKEAKKP